MMPTFVAAQSVTATPLSSPAAIQCQLAPVPQLSTATAEQGDSIVISSRYSKIEKNRFARFSGGVTMTSQQQVIAAENVEFDRENSAISASGDIHFQNQGVNVFADSLSANEESSATTMINSSYHLNGSPAHGSAEEITLSQKGKLTLSGSTFTTCQGDNPDWQLAASEINISAEENLGEAYNARVELFDIPVFYVPYFTFPVTDQRKSGFLYPKIGSSDKSGLDIQVPYYWNIAENYDATITPRYMSKRGVQLLTEFRYLAEQQSGVIDVEYLHKDDELKANDDPRYLGRVQHTGTFSDDYRAYIDYTTISDDAYLVDIGSKHYKSNDVYLYQIGELSYFSDNWFGTLKVQDFEVLGDHIQSYKTLPQLEFTAQQPLDFANGIIDFYSEFSRFEIDDINRPEANRYHVEAGVNFPINRPAWFINSEVKLAQTYYQQERIANNSALAKTVSRTLPKVRLHGGINFDRDLKRTYPGYRQTLEPQIQYLYIPEKDQSDIGLYDTATLQDDYNGLFRDRRFSGLDRIAKANQLTWGLTSRILDDKNQELMRFSLGRIFYLNDSNFAADESQGIAADESPLAGDLFFRLSNQWQFSGDIQFNTEESYTDKSQFSLDYRHGGDQLMQLNHRYSRNISGNRLEQASLLVATPIAKNWQFVGRLTHDLQKSRSLESYAGFQYESCCWALRFAYHRHIDSNLDSQEFINEDRNEFNSGFVIQFVLKGLNGRQAPVSTEDMFNSSIFGYKRPYFLNN